MTENDTGQTKPRFSRLTIIMLLCLAAGCFGILLLMTSDTTVGGRLSKMIEGVGQVLAIGGFGFAPFIGIAAMIVVSRSRGTIRGAGIAAFVSIGIPALFVIVTMPVIGLGLNKSMAYQMLCGMNIQGIGNALLVYAQDNDDQLPDPSQWCDLLVMKADISPASFVCKASDAIRGESSYAMNTAVTGMRLSKIPTDMVLLFDVLPDEDAERTLPVSARKFASDQQYAGAYGRMDNMVCQSRWNQVCGPEMVDIISHGGGCNILFGDMHVEFVKKERLPSLRWSVDEDFMFPVIQEQRPSPFYTLAGFLLLPIGLILTVSVLYVSYRQRGKARWSAIVAVSALSAIAGGLLGLVSQQAYVLDERHLPGAIVGVIVGILAALVYVRFLVATSASISYRRDVMFYAIATGMVTGAISSSVVHCVLIVISHDTQGGGAVLLGIPFGIVAGAILGVIGGAMMRQEPYLDKPTTETPHA